MFKIEADLNIVEINKFYLRNAPPNDFIFVAGKEPKTGTYFYYNFNSFDYLFNGNNQMLTCDKKYIDENFEEISFSDLQFEIIEE